MIYGSVCSGIEAASVAWKPLGWSPAFFSELDKFPARVLAHHYGCNMPGEPVSQYFIPNYGDILNYNEWQQHEIDVLVGGTPCQDFSVAGLRKGLAGERSNLAIVFARIARKYRPKWVVWENVPGVLSSNGGQDFRRILEWLSARSIVAPKGKWAKSGYIDGYKNAYGLAWRVLDAQFTRVDGFERAVPQRRRRLFVVGYLGDWRRAVAVLFDRASLQGYPEPRRKTQKEITSDVGESIESDIVKPFNRQSFGEYSEANVGSTILKRDSNGATDLVIHKSSEFYSCLLSHTKANGLGISDANVAYTLNRSSNSNQAIAFDAMSRGSTGFAIGEVPGALHGVGRAAVCRNNMVRRLTPIECERLMGFPDNYTKIDDDTKDAPRYKALGNSMAVNCMRLIGRRIELINNF